MPTTTVNTVWTRMALSGENHDGWTSPSEAGSTRSRPIEYMTRTVVLWIARKQLNSPAIAAICDGLQQPRRVVLRQRHERVGVLEEPGQLGVVVQPVARDEGVHDEHVEQTHEAEGSPDGQRHVPPGVTGLLPQRRRRVEADEGQDPEHDTEADAADAVGC